MRIQNTHREHKFLRSLVEQRRQDFLRVAFAYALDTDGGCDDELWVAYNQWQRAEQVCNRVKKILQQQSLKPEQELAALIKLAAE